MEWHFFQTFMMEANIWKVHIYFISMNIDSRMVALIRLKVITSLFKGLPFISPLSLGLHLLPFIAMTCKPDTEFHCRDGSACIDLSKRCDYRPDCADGSDERGCGECLTQALAAPCFYINYLHLEGKHGLITCNLTYSAFFSAILWPGWD